MAFGCGLDQSHEYPASLVHGTHRNTNEAQRQKVATTSRLAGFIDITSLALIPNWITSHRLRRLPPGCHLSGGAPFLTPRPMVSCRLMKLGRNLIYRFLFPL